MTDFIKPSMCVCGHAREEHYSMDGGDLEDMLGCGRQDCDCEVFEENV